MAYTKAQLEAIKNTLLASNQPILASQHRSQIQSMIDEMYDGQSRGNILVGVQSDTVQGGSDTLLIFRAGQAYQIPLSLFSATTLAGLGDVFISDVQNGDSIVYNTVNNRWENQNILLEFAIFNLSDVELTSLTNGDILRYDSVSQKWENENLATILSPYALLTDLDDYQLLSEKGQVNGYASLDGGGKVPAGQLPSYVDDVLEFANLASFPTPGETGKIYVALDTNKTYRWSGSAYIEISASDVNSVFGRLGNVVANAADYNSFYVRHDTNAQGLNTTQQGNARTNIAAIGGSGTAGQVSFWTDAGVQSGDSGLVWDNVGKRLILQKSNSGIESTSLVVSNPNPTIVGTESRVFFSTSIVDNRGSYISSIITSSLNANDFIIATSIGGGNFPSEKWRITSTGIFQSNGAQTIQTSGTEALTLQGNGGNTILNPSGGNVGIGTNSPASSLHVQSSGAANSSVRIKNTAANGSDFSLSAGIPGLGNSGFSIYDNDGATTRLHINSIGNVGIGTSSPDEKLHVAGAVRINTRSNATGNFATFSATGVVQERTAAEVVTDLNISGSFVTIGTTQTITGAKTFSLDSSFNGVNVGRGGGNITTNTRVGVNALNANTTGSNNTANGSMVLIANTTGNSNTSSGFQSLYSNNIGFDNTANGVNALYSNTTGSNNTINGVNAFFSNTTGSNNTGSGSLAGRFIANKSTSATILNNSIMIGYRTSPLANDQTNQIVIGYDAIGDGSNTTAIGNSSTVSTRLYGSVKVGTRANAPGNFATFSSEGVLQEQTVAQVKATVMTWTDAQW